MIKVAILDDYQGVALSMADFGTLPSDVRVFSFQVHLSDEAALVERLKDFQVICGMRERTAFPRSVLEKLPNLRLLITTGMANAAFDVKVATGLGILICGTGNIDTPTAELAWGIILGLMRHIPKENNAVRQGRWQTTLGKDLHGKTLGVLGLGNLGSKVATVGKAFGMNVIAWSQNLTVEKTQPLGATLVSKQELFKQADVITIHLRLSDRTRGLVGEEELALMKPTAFIVNTSRGPIIDENALVDAIASGSIAGAGIDVFEEEPIPSNHPLLEFENVIITPHLGYVSEGAYKVMFRDVVEDIGAYVTGKPVRMLNPMALENRKPS